MKINKYLFVVVAILAFSCEDYLDKRQEFDGLQLDTVFEDIFLATDFLDNAYAKLVTEVSTKNKATNADWLPGMTMSGEGYPGRLNNNVPQVYETYAQGDYLSLINWNPANGQTANFVDRYFESWEGIRVVNTFLENVDLIPNATEQQINGLKGQAYFVRAFYYHLMTKRHGGLIYFRENLDLNGDLGRARETYASNLENILEDLNLAIDLLPVSWDSENYGRFTKGTAMALKSRVTLFAASPLANELSWEDAAIAAGDLINFANNNGLYTLADASAATNLDVGRGGSDLFEPEPEELRPYRNIFVGPGVSKITPQEVIFMEANDDVAVFGSITHPIPRTGLTAGFDIIKGNGNPMNIGALASFVDKFETKNGLAIEDDPSYNPQDPFINRDPRFYNNILFDGVAWEHTAAGPLNGTGFVDLAIVNEEGQYGLDLANPTTPSNQLWRVQNLTGYRIRKWVPNGLWFRSGTNGNWDFHVNNIVFRMAEIYLNYAEATNEAYGPNGSAPGVNLTALQAVNMIRNRVGMPDVNAMYSGSTDALRERIRNERAIELCFEGIRYDDMRRWKILDRPENRKVDFLEMRWQGGPSAQFPSGFSYENVEQPLLEKTFTEKQYWWPIPSSEVEAVPIYEQTLGW